jgi:hypothetical protein
MAIEEESEPMTTDPEEDFYRHNYIARREQEYRKSVGKPGSKKRAKHEAANRRRAIKRVAVALKVVFGR